MSDLVHGRAAEVVARDRAAGHAAGEDVAAVVDVGRGEGGGGDGGDGGGAGRVIA